MSVPYTFSSQFGTIPLNELDANFTYLDDGKAPVNNPAFTGSVGIGTTSPAYPLQVVGNVGAQGYFFGSSSNYLYQSGANSAVLRVGSSISYLGFNSSSGSPMVDGPGGTLLFGTLGSERVRINSSGNVGIGTSSPEAPLHVNGTPGVQIYATAGGVSHFVSYPTASVVYTGTGTNYPLAFLTNNAERMRIDASGNVGIGTSSPSAKLNVATGVAGTLAYFTDSISSDFVISTGSTITTIGPTAGSTSLAFLSSNTERMRIDSSGNVGIGTSAPSNLLEVTNAVTGPKASFVNLSTTTGDYTGVLFGVTAAPGTGYKKAGVLFERTSTGAGVGKLHLSVNTLTDTSNADLSTARLTVDSTGNVGVGTTSPSQLLDVNSDSIRVRTDKTPASASATGTQGQIAWDANYLYVCTATNTWKRTALTTW